MCGNCMGRRVEGSRIQGETPIAFLNKVQKVAYTLNPFIVDVSEKLQKEEICVGKFLPIVHHDLPPKPVDIAENKESRLAYRRAAAEVMNRQQQEFKRSCRTRMTMEAVERFKDKGGCFFPWTLDSLG